jgi:hypothetical protein
MRPVTISAVLLGVAHVALPAAAAPPAMVPSMVSDDGQGVTLARAGASPFLAVPDISSGALLPVGEGGEGGRGRWRRGYGYGYAAPYWGPPRGYYYAPPPPRYRPPPPVYYAPPPPVYYAPPPPMFYAPGPGVSLNFRF